MRKSPVFQPEQLEIIRGLVNFEKLGKTELIRLTNKNENAWYLYDFTIGLIFITYNIEGHYYEIFNDNLSVYCLEYKGEKPTRNIIIELIKKYLH